MASGKPDYNRSVTIQGVSGANYVPIKVDATGQMFIALTGQAIQVNNFPSDYMKEGGNVAVSNHPSDYFKSGEGISGITNNVNVAQTDSDRIVKGKEGETARYIAVDSSGIILARLKAAFGEVLKDVAVDTSGILLSRLKGAFEGSLKDVALDTDGKMVAVMQGRYASQFAQQTVATVGDYDDVEEWAAHEDAGDLAVDAEHAVMGDYGMKFFIDASSHYNDRGFIRSDTFRGDFTGYEAGWIKIWVYFDTIDYLEPAYTAIRFEFGTDGTNYIAWEKTWGDLATGWNLMTCYLDDNDDEVGTIDWENITFLRFWVYEIADNVNDFWVTIDGILIFKVGGAPGEMVNVAVNNDGEILTKISGQYAGLATPIAVDIDGKMLAQLYGQFGGLAKVLALDTDGKMLAQMFGEYDSAAKVLALDTDGKMFAQMFGEYDSAPKVLALDTNGKMFAQMFGEFSGSPKVLAVDTNGKLFCQIFGEYDSSPKVLAVDTDGKLLAQISGDFEGTPKTIATDTNGIMKANLAVQDLTVVHTTPAHGKYFNIWGVETSSNSELISLFNDTTHKPGMVMGGHIYIEADASFKVAILRVLYDSVGATSRTLETLNTYNLSEPSCHGLYLLKYDDTNFLYTLGVSPGITYSTSLTLSIDKPAVQHTVRWDFFIQYEV